MLLQTMNPVANDLVRVDGFDSEQPWVARLLSGVTVTMVGPNLARVIVVADQMTWLAGIQKLSKN